MASRIGLTMRVVDAVGYSEPRDALAQDWSRFMATALPEVPWVPIPNLGAAVAEFLRNWDIDGIILTGGNDVGENPLRDTTESAILAHALSGSVPVVGICRGLQMIQTFFGGPLMTCDRSLHVATRHLVRQDISDPIAVSSHGVREVNSFHGQAVGERELAAPLRAFARSDDGLAEGIAHRDAPIVAVQWHPERDSTPNDLDTLLIRRTLAIP